MRPFHLPPPPYPKPELAGNSYAVSVWGIFVKERNMNDANEKIAKAVTGSFHKIERSVIDGYTKIEDRFIDAYLTKDGETVSGAKERLRQEQAQRQKDK